MELTLVRNMFTEESTIGELFLDGQRIAYTLEDKCREVKGKPFEKVYAKTAIPSGKYEIQWTYSNRFKRFMPALLNVPHFEGIRIHPLNTADQSEGCIGLGYRVGHNCIYDSKKACSDFDKLIENTVKKGEKIFINVTM